MAQPEFVRCVKVKAATEPSSFKDAACKEKEVSKGKYIRVSVEPGLCVKVAPGEPSSWLKGCATAGTEYAMVEKEAKRIVITTSGPAVLTVSGIKVKCKKDKDKGEIGENFRIVNLVVTFEGCVAIKGGKECTTNSKPKVAEGTIVTTTLKGELGTVAKAEAASEVGLLLEPASGSEFVTLEKNECIVETKVTGKVAGEVTPIGKLETTGKVNFKTVEGKGEKQTIKKIKTDSGKEEEPKLTAFGLPATEETEDTNTFEEPIEVT